MTYDQMAVMATALLMMLMAVANYAVIPAYQKARRYTLVNKQELADLRAKVQFQERIINVLQSDTIKLEPNGQLRFDLPAEEARVIRLPVQVKENGRLVTYYQVWSVRDWMAYQAGKILVQRNRRTLWVDQLQPGDRELDLPFRKEKVHALRYVR